MATRIQVLILEDRPADVRLMVHELRRAGFDPRWTSVDNELEYLAHLSNELDIILADYNLPQFDALRALERLKEHELDVPFILVSGTIGEELAVAAMKQGASVYLLKHRLARLGP
ncbi:MAG: response regulator, partial [Chloroflexota bacterium]|nr:response regulator [Chloroflexota bacterium]